MKLTILRPARMEERQAALHYAEERPELALRFRLELAQTLERVLSSPRQFPLVTPAHRKALLPIFPYAVIFELTENEIVVIAIAHLKRQAFYWQSRSN